MRDSSLGLDQEEGTVLEVLGVLVEHGDGVVSYFFAVVGEVDEFLDSFFVEETEGGVVDPLEPVDDLLCGVGLGVEGHDVCGDFVEDLVGEGVSDHEAVLVLVHVQVHGEVGGVEQEEGGVALELHCVVLQLLHELPLDVLPSAPSFCRGRL